MCTGTYTHMRGTKDTLSPEFPFDAWESLQGKFWERGPRRVGWILDCRWEVHIVAAGIGKDVRHSLLESGLFFGSPTDHLKWWWFEQGWAFCGMSTGVSVTPLVESCLGELGPLSLYCWSGDKNPSASPSGNHWPMLWVLKKALLWWKGHLAYYLFWGGGVSAGQEGHWTLRLVTATSVMGKDGLSPLGK